MTVASFAQGGVAPQPFRIAVEEAMLLDLKRRLDATRWPDEVSDSGWAFGTDLGYLKRVINYWRQDYDWRRYETMLNGFRQFTVPLSNVDVHFIYEQGEGSAPLPLLLTHGWPGSIVEFHKLIPLLTHPSAHGGEAQDAFTIVAPSIPGYGFSFRPNQRRFGLREIADTFQHLMTDVLGHQRFVAHGHDWGAFVATRLGYAYPQNLAGIHITLLAIPRMRGAAHNPSAEEIAFMSSSITGSKRKPDIRGLWGPSRRRSPTRLLTHRPALPPGFWRNSAPGATARATSTPTFRATSSSPTSCFTG